VIFYKIFYPKKVVFSLFGLLGVVHYSLQLGKFPLFYNFLLFSAIVILDFSKIHIGKCEFEFPAKKYEIANGGN
jgi:hypothetical protein